MASPPRIYQLLSLADLVTLFNLLLGFAALVALTGGDTTTAALLILLAALGDGADGLLARGAEASPFGEALDSLADLVAFGAAPALLLFLVLAPWPPAGPALGGAYLACGGLRLARFHLRGPGKETFQGLPITAGGLALSLLLLSTPVGLPGWTPIPVAALLCVLMVSNLEYPKLRNRRILVPVGVLGVALVVSQLAHLPARPWTALALLGLMVLYLFAPLLPQGSLWARRREPEGPA